MLQNPFAPHSPAAPAAFVDREREVELIFGHIKAAQRGNVAVSGPLGIGKTSLLHYVAHPPVGAEFGVRPPAYAVVSLDVHSVTPFSAVRFWHRLARLVGRQPEFGLDEPAQRLLEREDVDVTDVEELLDALASRGQVLALLLDEFEWALQGDTPDSQAESRNFLAQLASLTRRAPRVLSLVVATQQTLTEATRVIDTWRGSPFATVFASVALKPLGRDDVDRLLDRALEGTATRFGVEERQLLYAYSGGHPAAVEAAAFSLFHGRALGLDTEALRESARLAALSVMPSAEPVAVAPRLEPAPPAADDGQRLVIDGEAGEVSIDGRRVPALTALEYSLLLLLYDSPGRLCSKAEIIRHVWGTEVEAEVDDSRVEKLVSRLRRKVEPAPSRPKFIRTVRGRGYRLVP
jgi:hypothetical protein